ncbi:DUF21 domain-containing protein [Alloprevotella sp. OH1205_COT-284]|nr:CNNM domain-containing protein [Alloprevotella sp. OH1205_COT-284]RRD80231.1 DUF21 domain-containing protein [Alloprevotella sp. OH1205_COT-284]
MGLLLFYLLLSLCLSSLCSVLEAVLLATTTSFATLKEKEGSKTATLLKQYKADIDRPIAAILSLNTIAHTVGAAGVGAQAAIIWGNDAVGVASAVMTLLILVISEIIPKVIGATYWRQLALGATRIIRVLIFITYPLVLLSKLITHLFAPNQTLLSVSREEVQAMVNVGEEEGVIMAKENKAIQSFLKLGEVKAEQIMTPAPVVATVIETMTLQEFYEHGDERLHAYSRIPVYDEEEEYIKGYVLRAEVLEELSEDQFGKTVSDLIRPILTFRDDETVSNIWEKMLAKKEHISVIIDEYGTMRGIVTMEDVIETMLGVEIVDENDEAVDMQDMAREKWQQQQQLQTEP